MTPWTFHNPVDVRAGNGALAQLPRLVGARDALLIAFPEADALGLVGRVRELLGDRLVAVETDIRPNPDLCWLAPLYERLWREHRDARCVVALGGGSSIDCAKAMLTATPSGRFDELLVLEAQNLAANYARHRQPRHRAERGEKQKQAALEKRKQYHDQYDVRQRVYDIDYPHHHVIRAPAEITRDGAIGHADHKRHHSSYESYEQAYAAAIKQAREQIAP